MSNYLKLNEAATRYEFSSSDDLLKMAIEGGIKVYIFKNGSFRALNKPALEGLLYNGKYTNYLLKFVETRTRLRKEGATTVDQDNYIITLSQVLINTVEFEEALLERAYPRELKIAVDTWRKVFGLGVNPTEPPRTQKQIVKKELEDFKLESPAPDRICAVIVADKTGSKKWASIQPPHSRNEQLHPYFSEPLKIAVDLWKTLYPKNEGRPHRIAAKAFLKNTEIGSTMENRIIELTNPIPGGGRPKTV